MTSVQLKRLKEIDPDIYKTVISLDFSFRSAMSVIYNNNLDKEYREDKRKKIESIHAKIKK